MATSVPPFDSPLATEPPLSQVERVVDVFVAPSRTFLDIRRSAAWWLPFLLTVVLSLAFTATIQSKVGWAQVMENNMRAHPAAAERMDKLTPEQRAQQERITLMVYRYISFSFPLITLMVVAIGSGILMLTYNLGLGAQARYSQYFATYIYAGLPGAIKALLTIILVFAGGGGENFNIENPIGTNLGFYLSTGTVPAWLQSFLTSFDIFTLWTCVLLAIGLAIVCKVSRGTSYAVIFGWWGLIVLLGMARAAIMG
jgi:hypothetical protein